MTSYTHKSVLLMQSVDALALSPGCIAVDGTVGLGGHSEEILKRVRPNGILIGIDRDKNALLMAKRRLPDGFMPVHENFFHMPQVLHSNGIRQVDGILLDLGVSSYQLDEPMRGFSYQHDAPLDMRMDDTQLYSAKNAVNELSHDELTRILREYGEEKWAARIARFIVERRAEQPIETTGELVDVIKAAVPKNARRDGPHPAKRTFQALRIFVNDELDGLGQALESAVQCLKPGGRIAVITFHSLEDRIVKQTFARLANPCTCPPGTPVCICGKQPQVKVITKKPILPTEEELENNPRARSAKLRVAERLKQA